MGELLPLRCDGAELVAWNVTTVVDALHEDASELWQFDDGRVMNVIRPAFFPDLVRDVVAFRVPQWRGGIYVCEALAERAASAGLSGTTFKEVWRDWRFVCRILLGGHDGVRGGGASGS